MNRYKFQLIIFLGACLSLLGSCAKDAPNIYDMFTDISVTFSDVSPYSVVDHKEVNDGDSIYINFTITSANQDMAAVCVRREGQDNPVLQINLAGDLDKRAYTGVYKMKATRAGINKYRIYALNSQAQYIGDGYTAVTFNVNSNFTFLTNRELFLPDTVGTDMKSYYSIGLGKSFSYAEGQAASVNIDFGIYRTLAPVGDGNAIEGYWYHLYSPSANPLFFNVYDLSSWTKRATLFTNPANDANAFRDNLTSSSAIGTVVGTKNINLRETARTSSGSLKVGSVVYFKTPEGKFGAIHVKQISRDIRGVPYFVINTKVQN